MYFCRILILFFLNYIWNLLNLYKLKLIIENLNTLKNSQPLSNWIIFFLLLYPYVIMIQMARITIISKNLISKYYKNAVS